MRPILRWLLPLCLFGSAAVLAADEVVLNDGARIEGEVTDLGDRIRIQARGCAVTFPRSAVREVIARPPAAERVRDRRAALAAGDLHGRVALSDFCIEHNLFDTAEALLQEATRIDPTHTLVAARIRQFRKLYEPLPRSASAEAKLRYELGAEVRFLYGDHFLVAHDGDEAFARQRLQLLEQHYRDFYRYFEDRAFDLLLLDRRLEAVVFGTQERFMEFARRQAPGMERGAGYFNGATGRLYCFDVRRSASRAEAERTLAAGAARLAALGREIDRVASGRNRTRLAELRQEYADRKEAMARERWEWTRFFDEANEAVTRHEATHQLCHASGLLRAHAGHPTWLVEGLALYFENTDPFWSAAPRASAVDADRIEDLHTALRNGRMIALPDLIRGSGSFLALGGDRAHLAYAEAWALVCFLLRGPNRDYATRFFQYLRGQRIIAVSDAVDGDRRIADFRAAFGSELAELERGWFDFIRALPKPE